MAPLSLMNMLTNLGVADSDVVLISTSSDTVCAYIGNEQNNANAKPKNKFVRFTFGLKVDNFLSHEYKAKVELFMEKELNLN